ncbi:MAG: ROK family transcriptional regulator [Anaerolineales bacterium]|jgi:predicted NBD/HSP70 family sugar kinase|nr:ROK family transcriptional regulator [Anaerolineales bacterium]
MSKPPYYHQKEARQKNISLLLRDIWRHAPLSRAMLAERNGLTKATVSSICHDLAAQGLICDAGQDRTGVGRPGDLIELNPSAYCSIGLEISTNYIGAILYNLCGQPLWDRSVPIAIGSSQEVIIAMVDNMVGEAIHQAHVRNIPLLGVGVGVPGVVNHRVNAPALGWKEVPLKEILEQHFNVPVIVDNKARAAAIAEALYGKARDVHSFIYVSMGTDVHSSVEAAVVTEGALFRGASGRAVNAGHMVLDPNGPLCACGQRGCWQILVDVDREVGLVKQRLEAGEVSTLQAYAADGFTRLEHRAIHQAAVEGDALAREVASSVILNHALGITNLVLLFDPQMVVIGWETLVLPSDYTARMRLMDDMPEFNVSNAVRDQLARRGVKPPQFTHAALEPKVVMLGAASLLVDEFLRTPPVMNV